MEPPDNSPDSPVVQSSAAVERAYSAAASDAPTTPQRQLSPAQSATAQPAVSPTGPLPSQTSLQQDNTVAAPVQPSEESAIEQEWIERAKKVVSQTKGDPFMQNKLIGQLKAQYLATRYGRVTGTDHAK